MTKTLMIPMAVAAFVLLTAGKCSDPSDEAKRVAWCAVSEPVCWSTKDTPDTKKRAKRINAVGKELCGWTPRTKPCPKD